MIFRRHFFKLKVSNSICSIVNCFCACINKLLIVSLTGHQKAIYEKTLHLEDLLELQHLRDPVSLITSSKWGDYIVVVFIDSSSIEVAFIVDRDRIF